VIKDAADDNAIEASALRIRSFVLALL